MRRIGVFVACLFAGCGGGGGPASPPGPAIADPVLATLAGGPVRVTGRGFGAPRAGAALVLGDGTEIASLDPAVARWEDGRVEALLPAGAKSGTLAVVTPGGKSAAVPFEIYVYDWFAIPPTPGTNASPLSVAVGADGRVWINQEFHKGELHVYQPADGKVVAIPIPGPPEPGIFATKIFADHRTTMSMCGEDILVDPRGRVWFTQGGGYLYDGRHPNHSRVVCYDPEAPEGSRFRVYNVPGDQNEVIGIAWDAKRGRIWFAQGGLKAGARLWSFDPERVPSDPAFDFSTSLDALVNPADPAAGYRAYDLPFRDDQPAHLAVDPDGSVWFSAYWRNRIGRLVPETGVVQEVPLPKAIGKSPPTAIVGGGPWSVHVAADGAVVFNEFFDSTLTRIDAARVRAGDAACFALDGEGRNPCILQSLVVPEADLLNEQVHSSAYDREGRLWYTIHGPNETAAPGGRASLGFVTADWKWIVRLPPLPRAAGEGALSANGIAIDPKNGDIWFAEYWSHRLGRLRRQ